ncbi:MAG: ATP-dependent Clp protease ATP-binding subunit [Deltaproteobacteria bacterium]|nr:ATP-dependent Clp protease ATP-binding subunit [Deltaproteobacteria bacterium]
MTLPLSPALAQVFEEARDISHSVGQSTSSAHLLLAFFTVPNSAEILLKERKVDEDTILEAMRKGEREDPGEVKDLRNHAERVAQMAGAAAIEPLHLLVAMSRARKTLARALLSRSGLDLAALRSTAMSYLTGVMPRRLQEVRRTSNIGIGPTAEHRLPPSSGPLPTVAELLDLVDDDGIQAELDEIDRGAAARAPRPAPPPVEGGLDPKRFPWLCTLGRDLILEAKGGRLDEVVGREREISLVIDVLGKRRANNPVLVGDPGVGKTAIVEGLALRVARGALEGTPLAGRRIVELAMGNIVAGTQLRGSLSERLQGIKDEVRAAAGEIIVFIDELHTLIGAGSSADGPQDAANELKAALARGEFPCIGATTVDEYKKHIERDAALERRFIPIRVEEPSDEEARTVLRGIAPLYAEHHRVRYQDDAIDAAVHLSSRYITDRFLPGKAVDLLDLAGSRARHAGQTAVDRDAVARVVAEQTGVPIDRLLLQDGERYLAAERYLRQRIVGQDPVVDEVAELIRRGVAGFQSRRPLASMLFIGPSGVGKTELARALAEYLFATEKALFQLDMSEFGEAHAKARLIGSPPGYVGHDEGGQLTEAVRRRPHALVLLDEIDKAHPEILSLLLQVLDEGRLTDGKGRTVKFANTVVVLTANLGAGEGGERRSVGFTASSSPDPAARTKAALRDAQRALPAELWGRIDAKLVFSPLDRTAVAAIARQLVDASSARLATERGISYGIADEVVDHLIAAGGFSEREGARPLRRVLEREVEGTIAEAILRGTARRGDRLLLRASGGQLVIEQAAALAPVVREASA